LNWFRSLSRFAKIGFIGGIFFLFAIVGLLLIPRENLSREDQVASAVALLMQQAMASGQAPAQISTSASTETAAGISVEEGLLNVDITLPASLFSNSDLSTFDVDAYARENRFNKAVINEDGSITITLTKSRHKEILEEYAAQINKTFTEMIGSEDTPYITGVTSNSDFTSVIVDVDKVGYESTIDLTPLAIYFGSALYQAFAGVEPHCEITIRDNVTSETIISVVYPDALQ
jgi:hypothetical protein